MLEKNTRSSIRLITLASILEWHEVVLFMYWASHISHLFFQSSGNSSKITPSLFVFAGGFLARPFGGAIAGFLGNKYGRKFTLFWSIIIISLATFCIGIIPTYEIIGYLSWVFLGTLRIFQNLSAGSELPGAICYLYECSKENKIYISSYALVGPGIGGITAIIECELMKTLMPTEFLLTWGWRLSFIIGGLFGLLALFIRNRLEETPSFKQFSETRVLKKISEIALKKNFLKKFFRSVSDLIPKEGSLKGFFCSVLEIVGFVMLFLIGVLYRSKFCYSDTLIIIGIGLLISILITPVIGKIGQKIGNLKMLKWSAGIIAIVSYPSYWMLSSTSKIFPWLIASFVFIVLITIQFSLIPSLIAQLFPTSTRYMGIGLSFNLCDSLLVGFVPVVIAFLSKYMHIINACSIVVSVAAVISFISFYFVTEKYED